MAKVFKQICNDTFSFEVDYYEGVYIITQYSDCESEFTLSLRDELELLDFLDFAEAVIKEYSK